MNIAITVLLGNAVFGNLCRRVNPAIIAPRGYVGRESALSGEHSYNCAARKRVSEYPRREKSLSAEKSATGFSACYADASDRSGDFTGTKAAGADIDSLRGAVYDSLDTSDIRLPGAVRLAVGVRDSQTELDSFSADFTFCHDFDLLLAARNWAHGVADS